MCSSKDGHQGRNPLPGSHRRAAVDAVTRVHTLTRKDWKHDNAHCLVAGVHETLESSHQAQWPRGGHISHVFLLYSTVSWPSFIESIHALELS